MRYIKALLYSIKNSLTSIDYYKQIIQTNLFFSYKYFLGISLFIAIAYSISFALVEAPQIKSNIDRAISEIEAKYPNDLVFESKDGVIFTNQPEPYIIETPEYLKKSKLTSETGEETEFPKNIIVFDRDGTIEEMQKLDTLIMVNSVNFLIRDPARIQVRSTKSFPDFKLDKQAIQEKTSKIQSLTYVIPLIGFLFVFLASFVSYATIKFLDALFTSLVTFLLSKFLNSSLSYSQTLKVVLHTSTVPYIVESLIVMFKPTLGNYSIFLLIFNLALALFVIYKLRGKTSLQN